MDTDDEWPESLTPRVVRCVQPQWGRYSQLMVEFVGEDKTVYQTVQLDRETGEVISVGVNG